MSRPCLITYDIASPKRLAKLHRGLKRHATPIQYSLFHAELNDAGLAAVVALIERTMEPARDDVRIYFLPRDGWIRSFGEDTLPKGIVFTSLPLAWRPLLEKPVHSPPSSGVDLAQSTSKPLLEHVSEPLSRHQSAIARTIKAHAQTGDTRGIQLY